MSGDNRTAAIDILRGASAIAVALFHFNEPYPPLSDLYHRTLKWGWLGVPVFFVVSGFCIAAARQKSGTITFWLRRLSRIYPPYWASILVVLGVIGLRIATTGTNDVTALPKDLGGWVYTFAALTSPASGTPGLNWAYWSLGYELAFYLLMGVLSWRRPGVLMLLFSVLALFIPGYPFDLWGLFGLGVACYHCANHKYSVGVPLAIVCAVGNFITLGVPQALAGALAAAVIIFPPPFSGSSLLVPLRRTGLFSYSLYLTHVPIGCYLLPHYLPWKLERAFWPSLLQDGLFLIGCILFSCIFYRLVEKPAHDFARRSRPAPEAGR